MRSVPIKPQQLGVAPDASDEFDVFRWLNTIWRGKWRILFWSLIGAIIAIYYVYAVATKFYQATSTVALQNRSEKIVDLASPLSGLGGDFYTINTEVESMTSRELIGKLVDKLNLVEDPVFNAALRPPDDTLTPGKIIAGAIGAVADLLGDKPVNRKTAVPFEQVRESVIGAVRGSIAVTNLRASYVFYITVTTDSAEASARIANGLAEVYIENQIAIKYEATEQATLWLNGRLVELKADLERSENALKAFSAKTDLIGPETLQALNRQLKDRRDRVNDARNAAAEQSGQVQAMEAAKATGDAALMAAAANDITLRQVADRLGVEGARKSFDLRFDQILERARFEARRAETKITALEQSVNELAAQVERQSAELLQLQQLEREAAASRQIYEYFLGRLKEISVQQGIHRPDSRLLSRATEPDVPSAPRKFLIVAAALFLGALVGTGNVLLAELRSTGFRAPQDLELATGKTVFAQIPRAPVAKRRRFIRYLASKPASALAESIRNLRTSVMLSNVDNPPQVIMLTSSLPAEGKTTQSLALAHSFASMDRRVLLLEGDIRRRTFREYFRIGEQAGLIRTVVQELPLSEVVHHSQDLGIDVLVGEKSTINAADFFSSARIQSFLERARAEYDIIIIDTPPVLVVPDARMIGQLADAVLYVVHWNRTTRTQVEEGLNALSTVDVKISGLVLSQVDVRKASYYGGKYREIYQAYGRRYYRD